MNTARVAIVTNLYPLQIQVSGEAAALNLKPVCLVDGLRVGDAVWVDWYGLQLVILGRIGDGSSIPQLGSTEDLNNFVWTGRWGQTLSANTDTARNYPFQMAGLLDVDRVVPDGHIVNQRYYAYNGAFAYWRTFYNGAWNSWKPLGSGPHVKAYQTAAQSIPSGADTYVTLTGEQWDVGGAVMMHSTTSNSQRITFTIPGTYLVNATVHWVNNATGTRQTFVLLNGSSRIGVFGAAPVSAVGAVVGGSFEYQFAAGDYIELQANQSSGAALSTWVSGQDCSQFSARAVA